MSRDNIKLPAGWQLSIVTNSTTLGTYARVRDGNYGQSDYPTNLSASSTVLLGPYPEERTYEIIGFNGSPTITSEPFVLEGLTSSITELNILDGVTASAAEINKLDGVTASTAELNIVDGLTASAAELNTLDGITASTAELNILDGVTANATEINRLVGVNSDIQTQLDAKRQDANVLSNYVNDGAIAFTLNDQFARLSKASAGAYTLAAPTAGAHDGRVLRIFSSSNFAHVVTATNLIHDGVTGGS